MQKQIYHFNPVKIHRIEDTSLAISIDVQEQAKTTMIRFYEVNLVEQIYTGIGFRAVSMPLYVSLKSDWRPIAEIINKFIDLHPKHAHLLNH